MPSEVVVEGGPGPHPPAPRPERVGTDLSWLVYVALLATLAVDAVLAAGVAVLDTQYGQGAGHLLGVGLWAATAVINAFAVWNVARKRRRWFANVLLAQVLALIMAVYVLWVDEQSPDPGSPARWVALVVALVAGAWIALLVLRAPGSSAHAFGTSWRVVAATFSLLGLFSIWLQTSYLPSQSRPLVDLTTSLTSETSTATTTVLKADITLHNRGLANAVIVGSVYRITYQPVLPFTGPSGVEEFGSGNADLLRPTHLTTDVDDPLAQAFDFTNPNTNAYPGSGGGILLAADEIDSLRTFLLPGQTWSTEVVVKVPIDEPGTARLTAQIALLTSRYLGDTRACQGGTVNQHEPGFLAQAQKVHVLDDLPLEPTTTTTSSPSTSVDPGEPSTTTTTTAPNPSAEPNFRRVDFMCVQTELTPQNAVADLVGDDPSIRTYYVLADGPDNLFSRQVDAVASGDVVGDVPYLVTTFQNGSGTTSAERDIHATHAIDAQNPSAAISSHSEYGVP